MAVRDLILAMKREEGLDSEGRHCFTGYLDTVCEDTESNSRYTFPKSLTYRQAMDHLIVAARTHTEARLFLLRLEQQPVPVALQFDKATACLLREDPVAFLRMMDPTMGRPQKLDVSVSVKKEHPTAIKPNPLPTGHDTLADSFGDEVYIRRRHLVSDEVALYESPITGRWVPAGEIGVWTVGVNDAWGKVSVRNLLESTETAHFFLPRAWNKDGPWISAEDLRTKYDEFVKERERCSRTHKVDTSES